MKATERFYFAAVWDLARDAAVFRERERKKEVAMQPDRRPRVTPRGEGTADGSVRRIYKSEGSRPPMRRRRRGPNWPVIGVAAGAVLLLITVFALRDRIFGKKPPAASSKAISAAVSEVISAPASVVSEPVSAVSTASAVSPAASSAGSKAPSGASAPISKSASAASTAASAAVPTGTWNLLLVNYKNPIDASFKPELALVPGSYYYVDKRVAQPAADMMKAASSSGLQLLIASGYRSYERQQQLFDSRVASYMQQGLSKEAATAETRKVQALPGQSEHQTGLAIDFVSKNHQVLDEAFAATPEGKWLAAHCHEYGFILRYPKGKEAITGGIMYEPWHMRYVGKEAATAIMSKNITLEEYLGKA